MARGALLTATACGGVAASLRRMKSNPCRNGQERAAALHRAAQVRGGTRSKIASHPATGTGPAEKSKQFDRTCPANRRSPTGFLPPNYGIEVGTLESCHQLNQTEHFRRCIADLVRQAYLSRSGSWAPVEMEAGCTQPSGSLRQRLQSMSCAPGSAGSSRASRATEPYRSRGCPLPRLQRGYSGFLGRQVRGAGTFHGLYLPNRPPRNPRMAPTWTALETASCPPARSTRPPPRWSAHARIEAHVGSRD